jgi:hypothetical protein
MLAGERDMGRGKADEGIARKDAVEIVVKVVAA